MSKEAAILITLRGSAQLSVSCLVSAKSGTCTVVGLNGALVAKMFTITLKFPHLIFNKCLT